MNNPSLLEPGAKYFFNETLKNTNRKNSSYKNNLVNLGLFLFFITILGLLLYYKKQSKQTKVSQEQKNIDKQIYILNKLKQVQIDKETEKQKQSQNLITNLPRYESEFDKFY
tara:strand:+ start:1108 stop:1443 length:336 start_codon:yes stop_codon:yes gene_type:complete